MHHGFVVEPEKLFEMEETNTYEAADRFTSDSKKMEGLARELGGLLPKELKDLRDSDPDHLASVVSFLLILEPLYMADPDAR